MEVITTMKNPGNLGFLVLSRRCYPDVCRNVRKVAFQLAGGICSWRRALPIRVIPPGCLKKRGELFFSGRELSLRFT